MSDNTAADDFNAKHPVGTPVRYWPGFRNVPGLSDSKAREGATRTVAWLMGGHTPVVSVTGYIGGIALTHVEVIE